MSEIMNDRIMLFRLSQNISRKDAGRISCSVFSRWCLINFLARLVSNTDAVWAQYLASKA